MKHELTKAGRTRYSFSCAQASEREHKEKRRGATHDVGYDPVHVLLCGPPGDEEADGEAGCAGNDGHWSKLCANEVLRRSRRSYDLRRRYSGFPTPLFFALRRRRRHVT